MADELTLTVRTFRAGIDKEAALKPLEEAAEAYASWQNLDALLDYISVVKLETPHMAKYLNADSERYDLADELADCVTACCNLAARYGLDLQAALSRVEARNRERGRYGGAPRARRLVEPDPETDGATGRCSCGACGGAIDVQDRWCRWCGTELMGG